MLFTQTFRGTRRSNDVVMSDSDFDAIAVALEGVVTVYDEKFQGGTDCATPKIMNEVMLGVSRSIDSLSQTFSIKHLDPAKSSDSIMTDVALFDADFNSDLKATKIRIVRDKYTA